MKNLFSDKKAAIYFLLGLSLAISISAALICSGLVLLFFLYDFYTEKKNLNLTKSPLDIPIAVYIVWGMIVTVIAGSATLRKSLSAQSALLLFILIAHGASSDHVKKLIIGFLAGCVLMGLMGIVQNVIGIDYYTNHDRFVIPQLFDNAPKWFISFITLRDGRALGTRSHPLTYAETLIGAFFILLGLIVMIKQKKIKSLSKFVVIGLIVSEALVVAGLLLAHGRAVWLGLVFGCFVLTGMVSPKKRLIYICSFLILAGGVFATSSQLRNRFLSTFFTSQGSGSDQQSKSIRFYLWKGAFDKAKQSPIVGYEIRGVSLKLPEKFGIERSWSEAHNIFLQILLERGIIGLGLFLWILICLLRIIWMSSLNLKWIGLSIFSAFMLIGLTESWTRDKEVALIFWALMGSLERYRLAGEKPWG